MNANSPPAAVPNPIDLALVVSDRVEIRRIAMIETHATRGPDELFGQDHLGFKHAYVPSAIDKREQINQVAISLSFTLTSTEDDPGEFSPALLIEATFSLIYSISSFDGIDDRHLSAFAVTNGVYNAWPYWREYVQSVTVRMGLPPIVAPVFRVAPVSRPPSMPEDESHASQL